ncbi:hypothetical protein TNCV_4689321 [Trichonephila clavipes]|nr:hypothetical protein TNCV_4689321 [Trichonephila clavipes]
MVTYSWPVLPLLHYSITEEPPCRETDDLKAEETQSPYLSMVKKFGEWGGSVQVLVTSFYRGSKSQGLSRVASLTA